MTHSSQFNNAIRTVDNSNAVVKGLIVTQQYIAIRYDLATVYGDGVAANLHATLGRSHYTVCLVTVTQWFPTALEVLNPTSSTHAFIEPFVVEKIKLKLFQFQTYVYNYILY